MLSTPKYNSIRNVPAGTLLGNNGGAVGPAQALGAIALRALMGLGSAALASTGDFAAVSHTHPAAQISDATVAGRSLLTAADAPAQRTALGLGTAAIAASGDFAAASHSHTFASLTSKPTTLAGYGIGDAQPLNSGLTSLAGAATVGLHYLSAANTWSPVTIGTGLQLSTGTLSSTVTSSSPGGSDGQLQYKNGNSFAGAAGLAWSALTPNLTVIAQGASHVPLLVKAASSQSANLTEWQPSGSTTPVARVTAAGTIRSNATGVSVPRFVLDGDGTDCGFISLRGDTSGLGSYGLSYSNLLDAATLWGYGGRKVAVGVMATTNPSAANFTPKWLYDDGTPNWYIGPTTATSPAAIPINATGGSGSNVAGANLIHAAGRGTGTGLGGTWKVQVAPAGSTGSTLNTLVDALTIDSTKNCFIGNVTSAPGINPVGGGYLYVESGALKFRGSSGTVTTIAAA